ncbi:MAG: GxxExxY protein [Planctomycetota bacterium]|nr:GxxExxY protein [Planctomycetota bacterium]
MSERNRARVLRTNFPTKQYPEKELTEKIIGCAISVHRELGPGYLEILYERALAQEFKKQGLKFEQQRSAKVFYDGVEIGEHRIDLFVEEKVVVELKSVERLNSRHVAQVISTLKAVGADVGLLINFDESRVVDGIQRVVFSK